MSPELEHIRKEVERLTRHWSEAEWRRALPGKWSRGQVLKHLLLSYSGTTDDLLRAMEAGRPLVSKPTSVDRVRTLWIAKLGFLPSGEIFPKYGFSGEGIEKDSLRRFYDALVALDATLSEAERRFGPRAKLLEHPALGSLTAADWRQLHRAHTKRHLKEIARRERDAEVRFPDCEFSH